MKFLVVYEYFKESGKHYSSAEVLVDTPGDKYQALFATVTEARDKLNGQDWPGLISSCHHEFHVVVTVYDEPEDTRHNNASYSFLVPIAKLKFSAQIEQETCPGVKT